MVQIHKTTKPLVFFVSTKAPIRKQFCTLGRNTKHKTEFFSAKIGSLKTKINLLRYTNDQQTVFLTDEKSKLEICIKNWFCVCVERKSTTQKNTKAQRFLIIFTQNTTAKNTKHQICHSVMYSNVVLAQKCKE